MNTERARRAVAPTPPRPLPQDSRCARATTASGASLVLVGAGTGLAALALPYFSEELPAGYRLPALAATALGLVVTLAGMAYRSGAQKTAPAVAAPARPEPDITPIRNSLIELLRSPERQPSQALRASEATPFMQRTCGPLFARVMRDLGKQPPTLQQVAASMHRHMRSVPDEYKKMLAEMEALFIEDLELSEPGRATGDIAKITAEYMRYVCLHTFMHSGLSRRLSDTAATVKPAARLAYLQGIQKTIAAMGKPNSAMQGVFDASLAQGRALRAVDHDAKASLPKAVPVRRALDDALRAVADSKFQGDQPRALAPIPEAPGRPAAQRVADAQGGHDQDAELAAIMKTPETPPLPPPAELGRFLSPPALTHPYRAVSLASQLNKAALNPV